MQDFLDIVASEGACLILPPSTPIHQEQDVEDFAIALTSRLNSLLYGQEIRRRKYRDAADQWPPGHTPPELVERHAAELKALIAFMEAPSPPGCSDDEQFYLEKKKRSQQNTDSDHRPDELPRLPTPSPSNLESTPNSTPSCQQSSVLMSDKAASKAATTRGRKRQHYDVSEEESQHKNKKTWTIAAEADCQFPLPSPDNAVPEASTSRGKKRRLSDAEEKGQHKKSRRVAPVPERPQRSVRLHNAHLRRGTG